MKHVLLEVGITYGPSDKKVRSYMPIACDSAGSPLALSLCTMKGVGPLRVVALTSQLVDLTNKQIIKNRHLNVDRVFEEYEALPITPWDKASANIVAWR